MGLGRNKVVTHEQVIFCHAVTKIQKVSKRK
jgi:hypothetical protein